MHIQVHGKILEFLYQKIMPKGGHTTNKIKFIIVGEAQLLGILSRSSFAASLCHLNRTVPAFNDEKIPENNDFIPNVTPNIKSSINLLGSNINNTVSNKGGNIAKK